MANTNTNTPHAALLFAPGMGHIIPFLELAKRLVVHEIIPKVTFFLISIKESRVSQAETQILQSAKESNLFEFTQLPPMDIDATLGLGIKISLVMRQGMRLLSREISTNMTQHQKPTILITDLFGCLALHAVADKHRMKKYVFLPNALILALSLHTPTLDKEVKGEFLDLTNPIKIPGLNNPMDPSDLFTPMLDRKDQLYHEYVRACEELRTLDGILLNTCRELEPSAALMGGEIPDVPVYSIGPLVRETEKKRSHVLDWLDGQEEESVIYVSLGSGYTMSNEQIKEMASGLELSGNKFVWSMRPVASRPGFDHYFTGGEDAGTNGVSKSQPPSGFQDEFYKIQNMGLIVMDWAPQLEILRHPAVGGFMSHCGWSSVLESVSCGVPIVGWPLFADQRMNAAMLADEAGIAVRVEVSLSTNMAEKGEISKAIRKIMDKEDSEGLAMRKRVKELKHIAANAWSRDGHALSELASAFEKVDHSNRV